MKRFWKFASILLLGVLLISCGRPSPSDQVVKDLEGFKKISVDDLLSLMGNGEEAVLLSGIISNDEYLEAFVSKVMDFDYEIIDETVSEDGNNADVTVTISTYPFAATAVDALTNFTDDALFGYFDIESSVINKFMDLNVKSFSETIVIHCTKTSSGWSTDLQNNTDFVDAITGGMITGVDAFADFLGY